MFNMWKHLHTYVRETAFILTKRVAQLSPTQEKDRIWKKEGSRRD